MPPKKQTAPPPADSPQTPAPAASSQDVRVSPDIQRLLATRDDEIRREIRREIDELKQMLQQLLQPAPPPQQPQQPPL